MLENRNDGSAAGVRVLILRWGWRPGCSQLVSPRLFVRVSSGRGRRRRIGRKLDSIDCISSRTIGCPAEEVGGRLTHGRWSKCFGRGQTQTKQKAESRKPKADFPPGEIGRASCRE